MTSYNFDVVHTNCDSGVSARVIEHNQNGESFVNLEDMSKFQK